LAELSKGPNGELAVGARSAGGELGRAAREEPRRAPFVALLALAGVAALVLSSTGAGVGHATSGGSGSGATARAAGGPSALAPSALAPSALAPSALAPSLAERRVLSSSWFCAGGTASGTGVAPSELVVSNAAAHALAGSAELVSAAGVRHTERVLVPAGSSEVIREDPLVRPGRRLKGWVGAVVTLYGGMASVSQVVRSRQGTSEQPCASSAARQWYFASGSTLRNAAGYLSLLNPYPQDAIADLSFTTDYGREAPLAFQGIVVPPVGLTVVDLGAHLRRREHIATTVSVRAGQLVAYETEVVTSPPAGAPLLGTPGAANPVAPVGGVQLTLGTEPATTLWWPDAGDGPGLTETFEIYDPGPSEARLTLSLLSGQSSAGLPTPGLRVVSGAAGLSSSSQFVVPPFGWASVTTNGEPWALPASTYAARLESTNGVPIVAVRTLMAAAPSATRGLAALPGQEMVVRQWVLGGLWEPTSARLARAGQAWLGAVNPGPEPSRLAVERLVHGRLRPVTELGGLELGPGQRGGWLLPLALAKNPVVLTASRPVLVEQDWYYPVAGPGTDLEPGVPVGSG
jgi:hypothetical protein